MSGARGFLRASVERLISMRRGDVGENGVVGVLASETDFASSTVALCSSSSRESSESEGALEMSSGRTGLMGGGRCFLSKVDS